jgi:hypothetical protein
VAIAFGRNRFDVAHRKIFELLFHRVVGFLAVVASVMKQPALVAVAPIGAT